MENGKQGQQFECMCDCGFGLKMGVKSKRCGHIEQRYCCVVCNMKQHLELHD